MKNLSNLGVQELNATEMRKTDGGIWYVLLGAFVGSLMAKDFDELGASFMEGYNSF
ncbi:MAG: hypothetical protein KGV59_00270 [Tenacibaculum sp.]|nr:hypothetical protein [Tenacibaculum sp.]